MKWLKHDTNARNDTKIKLLKKKFKNDGYAVYFQLLEIIGENIKENNQQEWAFVEEIHTIETLADECGVTPDKLRTILEYCNSIGLLHKLNHKLCCPKILSRLDEYARKRKDGIDVESRQIELEKQCRDNVGTMSGQTPGLEQIRIDKNRIDKKRVEESEILPPFAELVDLTEDVLQEITSKYGYPHSFTLSKLDDLSMWLAEDSQNYFNKKTKKRRNLKLTLMKWVKRDAIELQQKERSQNARLNSKVGIDASGL